MKLTGGAVILNIGGSGAKGVKCDGAFEMSGGVLNATVSGGPLYEAYEYGDGTNLVVATTKTALVSSGTYLIEDVTSSAAVKCGTVKVSSGTVRIVADKQGDTAGTAKITGGTFYLVATNYGGKCFSIDGALTVGTSGARTLPTDATFTPDIQCSTFGQKLYVATQKLSAYTTLGTAVATTDVSSAIQLSPISRAAAATSPAAAIRSSTTPSSLLRRVSASMC